MSKSPIRRISEALGRPRQKKRRRSSGRILRDINGFRMHLDLDDGGISRSLNAKGSRESGFMYILQREINEGMVCFDLGANLGYSTLHMCREVGGTGFVYAIEPNPHNLELLRCNVESNHFSERCEISQGLISDESGQRSFWMSKHTNLSSVDKRSHSVNEVVLQAYSLADFFEGRRRVSFMKMDVEGHEVEILRGALDFFRKDSEPFKILFETHPGLYKSEDKFDELLRDYVRCGFRGRYMVSSPTADPPIFKDAGLNPIQIFYTDNRQRGLYENIPDEDMVRLTCFKPPDGNTMGRVRALMLQRG